MKEQSLIRDLARRVAEIAAEPRMIAILKRWRDVNALRRPDRAPVWCKPVGCWAEIIPPASLICHDPWLRNLEYSLRQTIFKREVDDDTPVPAWFAASAVFTVTPPNTWGVAIGRHAPGVSGGAWGYDPPLKRAADFDRLRQPDFTLDETATHAAVTRLQDLLGDILPVRLEAPLPLSPTLGYAAADLRGLEQMMMDMKYCIMWRQKASEVVFPEDDRQLRRPLRDGARRLQGGFYQIVLRELQTLDGHPDRLHVWTRYAKEAAERFA